MKNKKLFAILTLLCFMMTLMPVAAFAETVDGNNITVGELDAAEQEVAINVKGITAMNTTGTVYVYASTPDVYKRQKG